MLGTPSRQASLRVAWDPAQQTKAIWAVSCLPPLERGNCAQVRIFLMSVVIPEWPSSSLPMNMVAILVRKPHEESSVFSPHSYFSFKIQSYLTAGNLKQVSSCHTLLPSLFTTIRQQSSVLIQSNIWQTCNINHSFNIVSFPGSDYRRALQNWWDETVPADPWKAR